MGTLLLGPGSMCGPELALKLAKIRERELIEEAQTQRLIHDAAAYLPRRGLRPFTRLGAAARSVGLKRGRVEPRTPALGTSAA